MRRPHSVVESVSARTRLCLVGGWVNVDIGAHDGLRQSWPEWSRLLLWCVPHCRLLEALVGSGQSDLDVGVGRRINMLISWCNSRCCCCCRKVSVSEADDDCARGQEE